MLKRYATKVAGEQGVLKPKDVRVSSQILRGVLLMVVLYTFIGVLAGFVYGGEHEASLLVFAIGTFALIAMEPKAEQSHAIGGKGTGTPWWHRVPNWSLVTYCVFIGVGFNWVCVILWFSRRYALFSAPVVGATGLIEALYATLGLFVARLTGGNWRTALLVFALAPDAVGGIVLRLRILR